jgi:oligopeptide transport system substrate-binding protein
LLQTVWTCKLYASMQRLLPFLVVALLLASVGCQRGSYAQRHGGTAKAGVFRYPIVTNPTTLDPGVVQDGDTIDLLQQVYEGLVTFNTENRVEPLLAESWEILDGGRTYVFKIKQGVKFHNGQELTAEDFKWTYERNCRMKESATTETYLNEIVGAMDVIEGRAQSIEGIEVVDPYTLRIRIDQPRPYFLQKLTFIVNAVLPKDSAPTSEIRNESQMIGTGPFKAERYVADQLVILAANKEYHGGAPILERIERPVIKDAVTRLNKYRAGELDLVMLERSDVAGLQADANFKNHLKFFERPATWYVGMSSVKYKPFQDRRVRRAFAMAIDRQKIVEDYLGGINTLADGILPPGVLGHRGQAAAILPYDPEQARKLMAEAGYPQGRNMPPLELRFREQRPDIQIVAEAVAGMLKKELGVDVRLRTMEWRAFLEAENRYEHDFVHMRWGADYLDPENFLSVLLASYGPENKIGYANPEFDALCREGDTIMDEQRRLELYARAEDIALQDAPWIPIYFQRDAELVHPRVKGLRESAFGHLPHTTVRLED